MKWLFQPLLMLIANSTECEMARQIEYLKAENTILRSKLPRRIILTRLEKKRLVTLGQAVGAGVRLLLTIVSYQTFRRWVNQLGHRAPRTQNNARRTKPGRPKTSEEIRELVLQLARENDWGYTRILGELKKLGIKTSRSNIVNILRQNELDPKTDPGKGTWGKFVEAHAKTLWQCDFFTKHIITSEGIRQCFVLAFLHVNSRRVFLSPCTFQPDREWMTSQANSFMGYAKENDLPVGVLVRDRDGKFGCHTAFDRVLEAQGVEIIQASYRAPNMNAYIERFIQSIQEECLDKFIAFGEAHLDCLTKEYAEYYHFERPHQSVGNIPLVGAISNNPIAIGQIVVRERLGGVLRHYYGTAA